MLFKKTIMILVLSAFCANIALAKEQLLFAIDLTRHGDRTPIHDIPLSPYVWKQGLGELTAVGMKQAFELGVALRKQYITQYHLLPEHYLAESIYVRSTDMNRTLMTAQSLLLGLYPVGQGSTLPNAYQPIPIHTVPLKEDSLLNAKPSKNIISMAKLYLAARKEWQIKTTALQPNFKKWSEATGLEVNKPFPFDYLSDNLHVRALHHVPFPKGITAEDGKKIISFGQDAVVAYFKYPAASYPMGHRFLLTVADYLKKAVSHQTHLKYVLFSGHDSSIMSVMSTLGTPLNKLPPYASHLNFALFQNGKNYYIKIQFNNMPVNIPACDNKNSCTLEQFNQLVNS